MTRYFLKSISIEGFRGINNEGTPLSLWIESDKPNSVFGQNGLGKSSIYEALCYAIRGDIPKLEELQTFESPTAYYANRFHSGGQSTIAITFVSDDATPVEVGIAIERTARGERLISSPTSHPNPIEFLSSLNQPFALLDHNTFSRFIEDSPLNRGKSFSALLGLDEYLQLGEMLKYVSNAKVIETDLKLSSIQSRISGLKPGVDTANRQAAVSYEAATGESLDLTRPGTESSTTMLNTLKGIPILMPLLSTSELADVNFDQLISAIHEAERGDERAELSTLIRTLTALDLLGPPPPDSERVYGDEVADLNSKIDEIDRLFRETRGPECRHFYQDAATFLESGAWTESRLCPLCESELDTPVADILASRNSIFEEVDNEIRGLSDFWQQSSLHVRLQQLESSSALNYPEPAISVGLSNNAQSGSLTHVEVRVSLQHLNEMEAHLVASKVAAETRKTTIEAELPPSLVKLTEHVEAARSFSIATEQSTSAIALISALENQLQVLSRWKTFINNVSKRFTEEENLLATNQMSRIDSDFKTMYMDVMSSTSVVPALQRGSGDQLHVMLEEFYGLTDLSARALLSESSRNALAISLYLTAAMHHTSPCGFVVLDDVTSSFDSGHQYQLMEYIRTKLQYGLNPSGVQFVIFSHDGLLEKYFDRLADDAVWKHHRILGSSPNGMLFINQQSAQHIRDCAIGLIDAGQLDQATPFVRQYLEFVLLQVIRKVQIPVPIDFAMKDHMQMVGNCLNAIDKALDITAAAGQLVLSAQQLTDVTTIHVPAIVGNWTAHYGTGSPSSLAPAVLRRVLQTVDDYADCFRKDVVNAGGHVAREYYRSLTTA
jgi:DNA repair exonuclease SbcCD ATPase subunit